MSARCDVGSVKIVHHSFLRISLQHKHEEDWVRHYGCSRRQGVLRKLNGSFENYQESLSFLPMAIYTGKKKSILTPKI